MRKIIFIITMLFISISVYSSQKIIMLNDSKALSMSKLDIEKLGGKVIKEFEFINAVVAQFPDYIKDSEIYSIEAVKSVEDDKYIKWIEEITLPDLPSVESVKADIKENNYDYFLKDVTFTAGKLTDEELKEIPWGVKRVNAYKV
ncbi:MAG: hypothetical protein K6357_02525 [Elusimicrobiota bacterium]